MKKLVLCLLLFICMIITGCSSNETKEVSTIVDFDSIVESNSFSVIHNPTQYNNIDYINEASIATYDEDTEIEMVVYSNSDYASKAQEQQIESFNLLKSTGAYAEKEKGANYYRYALVSNNRYMVSTRIDNTLIFSKVKLEDRELIESIIESLGY